jgi:hypothetical protein
VSYLRKWALSSVILAAAEIAALTQIKTCREEDERKAQELARETAVAVLPPGTEEAWISHLERNIMMKIKRDGELLWVLGGFGWLTPTTTVLSANTPYEISCSYFDISVRFGFGEERTTVSLVGENRPPMDVHPDSIAGRQLRAKLCNRAAMRLPMAIHPSKGS